MIGTTDFDDFLASTSCALGSKFWDLFIVDDTLETRSDSLRDGRKADLAPLTAVGIDSLLSVSLASCIDSRRSVYESWKAGNLSRSTTLAFPGTHNSHAYFSAPQASSLWSSHPSSLCSLWKVTLVSNRCGVLLAHRLLCYRNSDSPSDGYLFASIQKFEKAPGPSETEERCFIRGDWRSVRVAERQVRGVFSFPFV